MKRVISLLMLMVSTSLSLIAQEAEMADSMRGEGKINIVVIVISIIVVGLFAYLFFLDKKQSFCFVGAKKIFAETLFLKFWPKFRSKVKPKLLFRPFADTLIL